MKVAYFTLSDKHLFVNLDRLMGGGANDYSAPPPPPPPPCKLLGNLPTPPPPVPTPMKTVSIPIYGNKSAVGLHRNPPRNIFNTKTIYKSRAITQMKLKCNCLHLDLVYKVSSYFQIKGHNLYFLDKIKRYAIQ